MFTDIKKNSVKNITDVGENYHDYHDLRDDRTVLSNPHKGWYYHYIDNGIQRGAYRDKPDIAETLTKIPGLHHLYLRFDWSDIEKQEGVYDWNIIDEIMDHYAKRGLKFSLRLCTYEAGDIPYATPEWVKKAGANGWDCERGAWQPDYGDEIYLQKLSRFMAEYGRKFDHDNRVEFVDVGTYGTWGEGHNGFAKVQHFPIEVLKKHINLHLKYFPNKPILVNDDMIRACSNMGESGEALLDYCVGKGLGFRDDTVLCEGYAGSRYDNLQIPFAFDRIYPNAPVDIESEHYHSIQASTFKNGFPLCEAVRRAHASYCGFHGYPSPWLEENRYLAEYLANRLGYWYFIVGAEFCECVSGYPSIIKLDIENKGFCQAYYPYTLILKLIATNDEQREYVIFNEDGRNLRWNAESKYRETLKCDFKNVPPGKYLFCIGMFENDQAIQLAIHSKCHEKNGFYGIDYLEVTEA